MIQQPVYVPICIEFDQQSLQLGTKSYIMPLKVGADLLETLDFWLGRPYMQEWCQGLKVVWIEGLGEVEMLIEDFA